MTQNTIQWQCDDTFQHIQLNLQIVERISLVGHLHRNTTIVRECKHCRQNKI